MRKILTYGYPSDWNFGGPSIILGFRELLRTLDPDSVMVCYETAPLSQSVVADYDFKVRAFPYKGIKAFWKDFMLHSLFRRFPRNEARREFWKDFDEADSVVNLFGICFCSGHRKLDGGFVAIRSLMDLLRRFSPSLAARMAKKLSVKSTCSYGPATRAFDRKAAAYASRWFFDVMVAREQGSAQRMRELVGGKRGEQLAVAPDVANLMPVPCVAREDDLVGLVVSYKMEQEWVRTDVGYIDCMVALIKHVQSARHCRIILIPNQDGGLAGRPLRRGDTAVARDIVARIGETERVSMVETLGRPALECKKMIARCALVVSPRYHACVAALTAGVPLLTLGWHEKYVELSSLYGQRRWMLRAEDCSIETVVRTFDELYEVRDVVATEIGSKGKGVKSLVLASGRILLPSVASPHSNRGEG